MEKVPSTSGDVIDATAVAHAEPPKVVAESPKVTKVVKQSFTYLRLLVAANPTKLDILLLCVGIIAAIAAGIPFPLLGIIFGQLVDNLNSASCTAEADAASAAQYQSEIDTKVLQVVYITIASFFSIYIYTVCWRLAGERLVQRLRDQYFRSLLRQEPSFFDNLPAGEVSSRLNGDIGTIQEGTSEKVGICLASTSFFVTAYIVAFLKDPKLAGMLISLVPAFLAMSLLGSKFTNKYYGKMSDHIASASSIASEGLSNVAVVHAFSANARLESKFAGDLISAQKNGIKKAVATGIQTGLLYFIAYAGNGLAFWQGSKTIANAVGESGTGASVGTTYTVIFILVDASIVLSQVAPFLQIFGSAAGAFEKLQRDMNRKSALDGTSATTGTHLEAVSGQIEFKNVSFSYPSRPDKPVIQDLSLVCPAGKHTAIVGLSGSGKSTIASLSVRLYDPAAGKIFLDGQDVQDINIQSLRSFISLVPQEPSLLNRSILENIALSLINSPAAKHAHLREILLGSKLSQVAAAVRDGQEINEAAAAQGELVVEIVGLARQAATLSDAIGFIDRLQYGLATVVGSTGNLMSGGQKQRIAVARALVRDPKILILDEATALLDSSSEQRIQAAIEQISEGRTLISIAHRLSTVKNADNIIVMRHGKIVEQGSHAELIVREDGAYASMVHLQSLDTQESDETTTPRDDSASIDRISTEKISANLVGEQVSLEKESPEESPKPDSEKVEGISSDRSSWSILKSLSPILRPYVLVLIIAFFTSTIVGGSYSAEAVIFGNTIGSLSPCNDVDSIRSAGELYGLLFFIVAIVEFFANALSWSAFGYAAEKILYKVRVLSFRSLFEQDLQWHQSEGRNPSLLLSFITKDGNTLGGLTGSIIGTIYSIMVNLLVAIILSHIIAWKIALVFLVTVPLLLGAGIMQLRVLTAFEEKHAEAFAGSTGITVEAVNCIKTVAALSLENEILGVYRRSLDAPRKEITKATAYANIWLATAFSIANFVYALAYWWGSKQIIAGTYTQTQFFTVLMALLVSAQLWGQMFMLAPDLSKARGAIARILNLIDLGSTDVSSAKTKVFHPNNDEKTLEGDIEASAPSSTKSPQHISQGLSVSLKDVAFSYPARPDIQVLTSLSLNIRPGQFCALVGPSGAGKSTIISLIERMYTPSKGSIFIDKHDISQTSSVSFRDDIALVPQDSVLFDGTIRFNVSLGARPGHEVSDAEIEAACKLANIHDTIISLPENYATNCGPNGNQLSGGQKQRLCIARALVRKPRLLLLDESTSALDAESEQLLQEGLDRAVSGGGVTVIAIAHRLRTIRRADVIFLIEAGKCVEEGTHEELVARSESYRVNALHQTFDS